MLKANSLSKQINSKKILKNLNFEINYGEIAIFLGESGAGKSTILRILNNLETFDTGSFTLDGCTLNISKKSHKNTVGMVFQHFNLFEHLNAEDNIILTLMKCMKLDKPTASSLTNHLLTRYELQTLAKEKVCNLSGGQKQRLAIARALSVNPKIICLDEPTSALDPRLTKQVAKLITELANENQIVILTTHDMSLLEELDGQLFLMENGSLIKNVKKSTYLENPSAHPELHNFLQGIRN